VGFVFLQNINDDQLIRKRIHFINIKFYLNEIVGSHWRQVELKSN
jgi:hypothetical protein